MTTQTLRFIQLSDVDRRKVGKLVRTESASLAKARVAGTASLTTMTSALPRQAAALVTDVLDRLVRGESVAVLAEDQELTPNEIARVVGLSRPLVVRRMDVGELPFRYIGKHRRAAMRDVVALKARLDAQKLAIGALADDTGDLMQNHGL